MNIATYQTTPETHGNGTFFLQIVDIICILEEMIWRIMDVYVQLVSVKEYRQSYISEVLKKQMNIGTIN